MPARVLMKILPGGKKCRSTNIVVKTVGSKWRYWFVRELAVRRHVPIVVVPGWKDGCLYPTSLRVNVARRGRPAAGGKSGVRRPLVREIRCAGEVRMTKPRIVETDRRIQGEFNVEVYGRRLPDNPNWL
jgi:hypothetical protein